MMLYRRRGYAADFTIIPAEAGIRLVMEWVYAGIGMAGEKLDSTQRKPVS
jgi:hypothetical protein